MEIEEDIKEKRLKNRYWLVTNFDRFLEEAVYYRMHKENFENPKLVLWELGDSEESRVDYEIT